MAKRVQRRRGTASEHAVFTTGGHGELTVELPNTPVTNTAGGTNSRVDEPAQVWVHYGDERIGDPLLTKPAIVNIIKEYIDRQVFLARVTGYTAINGDYGNVASQATFTFGDSGFDDVNDATITLTDGVGTTKVYKIKNDYSASSALEFNAGASATAAATNFKIAVESSDGHNGTITVAVSDGQVTMSLSVTGESAAATSTVSASTSPSFADICDVNPPTAFSGGNLDDEQLPCRWLYEWEEVAIHTPQAQEVELTLAFAPDGTTWDSDINYTCTFDLPYLEITNPGYATPTITNTLKSYSVVFATPTSGTVGADSKETTRQNFIAAFNAISDRKHIATAHDTNTSMIILTRYNNEPGNTKTVGEPVLEKSHDSGDSSSGKYPSTPAISPTVDITGVTMTVTSGAYQPEIDGSNEWTGDLPTLDGLFMQYGVTTQGPAINSTKARTWKSVDGNTGEFYGLNTLEFNNFYVTNDSVESDGYGLAGAGVSLTTQNNSNDKHDGDGQYIQTFTSPGPTTNSGQSNVAKRVYPNAHIVEPIRAGTVVVMHERWTAQPATITDPDTGEITSTEAAYSGLQTMGDASPNHLAASLAATKYTPSGPFYYFSVPNVHQGSCT